MVSAHITYKHIYVPINLQIWTILRFFYLMIFSRNLRIWAILRFDSKFVQRFLQKKIFSQFNIIIITLLINYYYNYFYYVIINSLSLEFSHFFLLQVQWELQWLPFILQLQLPLPYFLEYKAYSFSIFLSLRKTCFFFDKVKQKKRGGCVN